MTMKMVNIFDAKARLSELLDDAARGERIVICKRNQPVAELRPIARPRATIRPLGLAAGTVAVPATFFDPLPESMVETFEATEGDRPGTRVSRVAEARQVWRGRGTPSAPKKRGR